MLSSAYWVAAFNSFYVPVQRLVVIPLFEPPRARSRHLPTPAKGRIAVVGAGLTGVTCAAHAIAHGFDVTIYEQTCTIGGMWANVNQTAGLQHPSLLYRFHPSVLWSCAFPKRGEILYEVIRIWEEYQLKYRTRFGKVTSVERVKNTGLLLQQRPSSDMGRSKWIINDGKENEFDAVVVAVGTCGAPKRIDIPGLPPAKYWNDIDQRVRAMEPVSMPEEVFEGKVVHWSKLREYRNWRLEEKTVFVIGNDANGVGAVEIALAKGAKRCVMVAGGDKWIIRQNLLMNTLIALQSLLRHCKLFSTMLENVIKMLNYCGAPQLVPEHLGIFEDTPVVHDEFVNWVRQGRCEYVRGDIDCLTKEGLRIMIRDCDEMPGEGRMREYEGDMLVYTTGFSEPDMAFLKGGLFPEGYEYPTDLYFGSFSTEDWSVVLINPGTAGHWRTGIYMRILLTFLEHCHTRPTNWEMKSWVDSVRYCHQKLRLAQSSFWSYVELVIWLSFFYVSRVCSLKLNWGFFIMQGWGGALGKTQ